MKKIFWLITNVVVSKLATGQIFEQLPLDLIKGERPIEIRQVLPTTKGTVLLATSISNLGEIDKMRISLTLPGGMYEKNGERAVYKQESIQKDLYQSFTGIKLIAEGPGKIFYVVSDNNNIGVVNYNYGKYAINPPFLFPGSGERNFYIKKLWIDPEGDLYLGTSADTLYIYAKATDILDSVSPARPWYNYDYDFDKNNKFIITKGEKKLKKIFFGEGIVPQSFAFDSYDKIIWVGTNRGIFAFDKITGKTIKKFPSGDNAILTVTDIDIKWGSSYVWFSTLEKGMGRYNTISGMFDFFLYKKRSGRKDEILNPVSDFCRKSGNELLVAATDSLPAVFNTDTGTYYFINDSIFKKTANSTTAIELDANGGLYLIKGGRFFYTKPGKFNASFGAVQRDSSAARVLISDVRVGGVSYSELKSTHANYEIQNKVELNYNENSISILYSARGYSSEDTIVFAYKLEGYDADWINASYSILDEKMNMAVYPFLMPGTYTFKVKVKKGNEGWQEKQAELAIIIKAAFWQNWWFRVAVVVLLSSLIFLIVRLRVNSVRKKERAKSAYEKDLLELEARALRAQMNPHFIFNCLNSIKSLIQEGQAEKSVIYLTTFSKLIRTLFNNTDKKEITLYDEIETCRFYLQLESMRFDAKFSYKVSVDEHIDLKSVQIPALIIQPFIENAIWHGIMPKAAGGNVSLGVSKKNGHIEIVIEDDGIGREASYQNKSGSLSHQSRGVNLTQARLKLDNLLQQRQATFDIIDKKDKDGSGAGTVVVITIKEEI